MAVPITIEGRSGVDICDPSVNAAVSELEKTRELMGLIRNYADTAFYDGRGAGDKAEGQFKDLAVRLTGQEDPELRWIEPISLADKALWLSLRPPEVVGKYYPGVAYEPDQHVRALAGMIADLPLDLVGYAARRALMNELVMTASLPRPRIVAHEGDRTDVVDHPKPAMSRWQARKQILDELRARTLSQDLYPPESNLQMQDVVRLRAQLDKEWGVSKDEVARDMTIGLGAAGLVLLVGRMRK